MAIIDWTSEGMIWPLTAKEPIYRKHIEALRLAWLERWYAVYPPGGSSIIIPDAALTTPIIAGEPIYNNTGFIPKVLDDARSLLDNKYINQEDNAGDWNGSLTNPADWNQTSLLLSIGGGAGYINAGIPIGGKGHCIAVDWANEHYDIINKLLWVHSERPLSVITEVRDASASTYAQAVINWNGASYVSISDSFASTIKTRKLSDFELRRIRKVHTLSEVWDGKQSTIEVYNNFNKHPLGANSFYDNQDYPLADDNGEWATIHKILVESTTTTYDFDVGNFTTYDSIEPTIFGETQGWITPFQGESNEPINIVKYDGANGFEFKL